MDFEGFVKLILVLKNLRYLHIRGSGEVDDSDTGHSQCRLSGDYGPAASQKHRLGHEHDRREQFIEFVCEFACLALLGNASHGHSIDLHRPRIANLSSSVVNLSLSGGA
jgi:hypothetical protein